MISRSTNRGDGSGKVLTQTDIQGIRTRTWGQGYKGEGIRARTWGRGHKGEYIVWGRVHGGEDITAWTYGQGHGGDDIHVREGMGGGYYNRNGIRARAWG